MVSNKNEYSGWGGVRKLAKNLGYSWFDVCDILWKTKHLKQPAFKKILIFSVIRKNLIEWLLGRTGMWWMLQLMRPLILIKSLIKMRG